MILYNRNSEILKSFFRKPMTLIISILFFLSAVTQCIYIIMQSIKSEGSILLAVYPLFAVLPAVAFLNLFVQGRKKTAISRLNTPLILIYIYAVLIVVVPLAFFVCLMPQNGTSFILSTFVLIFFIVPILILLAVHFLSMIITLHSMRKSVNGIYLSKKGSVFMGITSIVVAAAVVEFSVNLISGSLNYDSESDSVILIIGTAVLLALFICLGIWAMMYSRAIQNAAVFLHGTSKKRVIKIQTLADTQAKPQAENNFTAQQQFCDAKNPYAAVTSHQSPDIFTLPEQDEPNPYETAKNIQKQGEPEETLNHINFQNPYENFTPQNPFNNEDD